MTDASGTRLRLDSVGLAAVVVTVAALIASGTSLANGFTLDDVYVVAERPLIHSLDSPWSLLTSSYWQVPPNNTLWRPLGLLAFAVQWAIGQGAALAFHAVNVGLYAGTSLAVLALARAVLPPIAALVAGLVFAVHPVHVESVGNVVGQLELWVAAALVGATLVYVRARRRGPMRPGPALALVALYAAGLGMKEHAVVLPGLLIAAELTLLRRAAAPFGARERLVFYALLAVAAMWLHLRFEVVGSLAGEWPHLGLQGLDLWGRGWVMLALVPEIVRLLVWPARLYADYSPQYLSLHPDPGIAHVPGALLVAGYVALLAWSWSRDRVLAFALLWLPVSLAVVSNVLVPTGVLLAERTLFLATVGVALAGAALVPRAMSALARSRRPVRTGAAAALVLVLGLAAAHSAERQRVWKDGAALTTSLVVDAPENFRGHLWLGDALMRSGDLVAGEQVLRRAIALWPAHDSPPLLLALRYQEHGRCDAALPLFESAGRLQASRVTAQFGRAGCLLQLARLREARAVALEGLASGRAAPGFRALVYATDSVLAATDSADAANWWLRRQAAITK